MKYRLYRNGSVMREGDARVVDSVGSGFTMIIEDGKRCITNAPMVIEGLPSSFGQPSIDEQKYNISLALDGNGWERWEGCTGIAFSENKITFWHDGMWKSVSGLVMATEVTT